jgi:hypothetical protein
LGGGVLTYKSFNAILQEKLAPATHTLMVFPVIFDPDESDIRELYMPPALVETLAQNDPKKARDYCANIRAFLKRYIIGAEIDNHDYMKSWRDDIFEMRVQNQKKGERVRIFGAFGAPDKFVAFFRRPRNYFGDKYDPNGTGRLSAPLKLGILCFLDAGEWQRAHFQIA